MRSRGVNEFGLAVLLVVVALLVANCIWLHVKCRRQGEDLASVSRRLDRLENPPPPPPEPKSASFAEKAKETYEKVKSAAARGYKAAKEELEK